MYLCIDIGNSRTKCAVFDEKGNRIVSKIFDSHSFSDLYSWAQENHIIHAIISSTGADEMDVNHLKISGQLIRLSHDIPLPIQIVYSTPATLGRDRIAAVCGAHASHPHLHCLVVDAGTCMTADLLLSSGIFLGGNISPGLHMRLLAMHEHTARLPLAEPGWPDMPFGDSTIHALQNGAGLGMIMEIEGLLNRAREAYGTVSIVITGGDSAFLAGKLESEIFVEPELVMQGLFQILSFNVKNSK